MDGAKEAWTRRDFLYRAAAVGGSALLLTTMNAWGMGIASRASAPPALSGSGKGKRVLVLGAGLAGMTAAFELGTTERTAIIAFDSVEAAVAAYESPAYQEALAALGGGAERDIRIVEAVRQA